MMKLLLALAVLQGATANSIHERLPSVFSITKQSQTVATPKPQKFILKDRSIHDRRFDIKKGLRINGDVNHEVIFSVKQNLDELKTLVEDVSNPFSANYGKHLKRAELNSMTAIPESFQHVMAYLKFHDIQVVKVSAHSEYITASAPISKWEELFATEFYSFEMESLSSPLIRAEHYSLPENLHAHVQSVFKTVQFPLPKRDVQRDVVSKIKSFSTFPGALESGYVTPQLIYDTYDIRSTAGSSLASQGVYETQQEAYSPADLRLFQDTFGLPRDNITDTGVYNDDDACSNYSCFEGNLDVQYITAVASGVPTYYSYDDSDDFLLTWASEMAEMEDPPKVLSISWGGPEFFYSSDYIDLFNTQALKLASLGVTVMVATGDDGASSFLTRNNPKFCGYHPDFPSASPYVTAVGATMGPELGNEEVGCQQDLGGVITSGGGFSIKNAAPSWQKTAVATYFANAEADGTSPIPGYASGRATPDVSLLGASYVVVAGGDFYAVSGTSASSPAFGGMVSLVNSKRLEAGKSTLGWINPALYALADNFVNDITKGANFCGVGTVCCEQGYTATAGWDPVTGLGSVNYTAFEATFFALGDNLNIPTLLPTRSPSTTYLQTRAPSARASRTPTASPTLSSGWMYANYFSDASCAGDIDRVEGWKTDTCLYGGEESGVYYEFICDAVNGHITLYSDSSCEYEIVSVPMALGTCSSPDYYYYYAEDSYSFSMGCTNTNSKPLDTSTSYVLERHYTTPDGCNWADEFQFDAFRNKNCFSYPQYDASFKFRYPEVFVYANSSTCDEDGGLGQSSSETLDTTCEGESNYAYYFYRNVDGSMKYDFVQSTTTRSPTHKPSAAPTHKPDYYMMTVEQIINGISAETFNADVETNSAVFAATLADCMEGIEASDVSIESVTDVETARLRRLTTSGVHMEYAVSYDIGALGYHGDAEGAYNYLIGELEQAIEVDYAIGGTHFNRYLAANIEAFNASSSLDEASGGSLVSSSYEEDISDDPPVEVNHKKRQTRYFIIGVIAGGGGFLILSWIVIYGLYYWYKPAGETAAAAAGGNTSASAGRKDGFEAVNTKETELTHT